MDDAQQQHLKGTPSGPGKNPTVQRQNEIQMEHIKIVPTVKSFFKFTSKHKLSRVSLSQLPFSSSSFTDTNRSLKQIPPQNLGFLFNLKILNSPPLMETEYVSSSFNTPSKSTIPNSTSTSSKVRVIVRARPFLSQEIAAKNGNSICCISVLDRDSLSCNEEVAVYLKDPDTMSVLLQFLFLISCSNLDFNYDFFSPFFAVLVEASAISWIRSLAKRMKA